MRVYEAKNHTLREAYVDATALSVSQFSSACRCNTPPSLSHWDFKKHHIAFSAVGDDVADEYAGRFIRTYIDAISARGWKTVRP